MSHHTVSPIGFHPTPLATRRRTLTRTHPPPVGPVGLVKQKRPSGTLGEQVLAFARSQIGKTYIYKNRKTRQTGRGECWDLAEGALNSAEAKTSTDLNRSLTADGNYKWGEEISFKDLQPGDIIQFRDHVITYHDKEFFRGHHTAIVEKLGKDGAVHVIEQHVGKDKAARSSILYFYDTTIEENGQKTSITVRGDFWFYRPMHKVSLSDHGF